MPDLTPKRPAGLPISRRSLLRGGVALGLSTVTVRPLEAARAFAAPAQHPRLVLRYQPRQPTGWPSTPGHSFSETIGGHRAFEDFRFNGERHRISLLGFRKPGDRPDPVYESVPTDREIAFKATLAKAFGADYAFRYLGGFGGRNELSVQSYSVFVETPTDASPQTGFGADLYLVYTPDVRRDDPPVDDRLQWIQVARWLAPGRLPESVVDNFWRANPYYLYGGTTSINGSEVVSFHDVPQTSVQGAAPVSQRFMAEVFLVQDTGGKDVAGRGIVNVLGGVKYGWQVE